MGDGVREPEDQAGPCRLLSGFWNLFFLRKEISRKQIWSTLSHSKKSLWLPRRLWESNRDCYEDLLTSHDMPTLIMKILPIEDKLEIWLEYFYPWERNTFA